MTRESPLPLFSSMRIGPLTVSVLSKLPSAVGCEPQPQPAATNATASSTAAIPNRFGDSVI